MKSSSQWLLSVAGRLSGVLLVIGLVFGAGAPGATAVEPPDRPTLPGRKTGSPLSVYADTTLTIDPMYWTSVEVSLTDPDIGSASRSVHAMNPLSVGWTQYEGDFLRDDTTAVAETLVRFDLTELDNSPRRMTRAFLRFDETADIWTNGSGASEDKEGCVAILGLAKVDRVAGNPHTGLFPNEHFATAPTGSTREWDVTSHVRRQLEFPQDATLRYGYVLRGSMNLPDLRADDDTSCRSVVNNIRLEVTLSDEPPPPPTPTPTPTPRPADLSIRNIRGREDVDFAAVRTSGGSYLIEIASERASVNGNVVVDIETSGVITLGDQIEVVQRGWTTNGFTCVKKAVSGGANSGLRCSGGTLKAGQVLSPAIIVRFTRAGIGAIHASIGRSNGAADYDQSDNGLALTVRVN